jgi:hypothetical protein
MSKTALERFLQKIDREGPAQPHMLTPCWVWTGARNKNGYGRFAVASGKIINAHCFAYERLGGFTLGDGLVLHRCDNPACVRPAHLYEGTHKDNAQDREQRARGNHATGVRHGCSTHPGLRQGVGNGHAKLTENDVRSIRVRHKSGERQVDLAKAFGLTKEGIFNIVKHKTWRHVEG